MPLADRLYPIGESTPMPDPARVRVAVLGGGTAALTAAYYLATAPDKKYDVTVHSLGWRLGGKGASGRNATVAQRIEEHGLHVWSGFYENAFVLMRACYGELGRTPGQPLSAVFPDPKHVQISPAFKQHNLVVATEYIDQRWIEWVQETPSNDLLPGDGTEMTLRELFGVAIEWLEELVEDLLGIGGWAHPPAGHLLPESIESLIQGLDAHHPGDSPSAAAGTSPGKSESAIARLEHTFVSLAAKLVRRLSPDPAVHDPGHHDAVHGLIDRFLKWAVTKVEHELLENDTLRRAFILVDLVGSCIRGVLADGVLTKGTTAIDGEDLIDWLARHGAHPVSTGSALIRGYYDYCFAYEGGDPNRPRMAAGDGLLHLARLTMNVKGAVFWKMQAGMGDTIFGPLYLVLRNHGVKFEFFRQVVNLHLTADRSAIERVDLQVQADVTEAAKSAVHTVNGRAYTGEYWPLVDVLDLPCWPNQPDYGQLVQGNDLKQRGIDLENPWSGWPGVGSKSLTLGVDFDVVVLATSHGPLQFITSELMEASAPWREMVDNLRTTQTVGVQLWCRETWPQLGWKHASPLLTSYAQPIQTWGDFSQVLPRECWPAGNQPGSISYLCGNLPDRGKMPPFSDTSFPARQQERLEALAEQWLTDNANPVWPDSGNGANPTSLDWSHLADLSNGVGYARFKAQFFRANISPSERYVLTVPNDFRFRMKEGRTPFSNLVVAGDFVFTGILGSVEAAVMTGMMASRAISGYPGKIFGEVKIPGSS
jgi:uncharacterized protein with NAD-binding domain and iron-sulfur cluster